MNMTYFSVHNHRVTIKHMKDAIIVIQAKHFHTFLRKKQTANQKNFSSNTQRFKLDITLKYITLKVKSNKLTTPKIMRKASIRQLIYYYCPLFKGVALLTFV